MKPHSISQKKDYMSLFNRLNGTPKLTNGVAARRDGQGSLFGNMHREELGKQYGMFDIDALSAEARLALELTKEEIGFIEYRTYFNPADVRFVALFEVKFRDSDRVQEAMKCPVGSATFAQKIMAKRLGARYFFIIQSGGQLPFKFVEITDTGCEVKGTLCKREEMCYFWECILKL